MSGKLYIIGTPIGNLEDITLRAIKTLNSVSIIACENISRSRILLNHLNISPKRLIECSPSNERNSALGIIQMLENGDDVAYISDAGTPSVSDPGTVLVRMVADQGIIVTPIPGVSALTTILSVAGINAENVVFTGFLSKKEVQVVKTIEQFAHKKSALVIFVSCHQIKKFLKTLKNLPISADICLGRELTKSFETIYRGSIDEVELNLPDKEVKGEFVAVLKFEDSFVAPKFEQGFSKKEKRQQKLIQKALDNNHKDGVIQEVTNGDS